MSEQEKRDATPAYYANCPKCGGNVWIAVDIPEMQKDNAKEAASCIRKGFTIGHSTVAEVRKMKWCEC